MSEFAAGPAGRIERVRALMVERGYDAIVVRDEANLRWLTGVKGVFDYTFEFPHAAFITADQCLFHTDSRYLNSFEENTPAGSPWVFDMDEGTIPGWVAGKIAANKCRVCAVEDDMQINFYQGIQRGLEDRSVACMLPLMHDDIRKMRAIKDAEEIELMRHAQSITDAAFQHMLGFIKPGMTEKQVRNELENFMFANGADSLAFGSIVASGPNTANPHAVPSDRVIEKGDFVLMDYGAGYCDYRSDMTRTVVMGEPTQEQLDLYALVRRTHEECVAAIHPGVEGNDIFKLSKKIIGDAGYGDYYNHGLGHGVGIDIHELPNFNRSKNIIEIGSVVTMEPGVYLPGVGGVLTFLPQIAILFFFLSLLEDSGYMSRTAFIMDKPLRRFFIYRCFRIIFKPVGKYGLISCGEVSEVNGSHNIEPAVIELLKQAFLEPCAPDIALNGLA